MENSVPHNAAPETAPANEEKSAINTTLKLLSYPLAVVAGAWATNSTVRAGFYKGVSKLKEFKDIEEKYGKQYQDASTQCKKGLIDKAQRAESWATTRKNQLQEIEGLMETLGTNTFLSKWKEISRGNQQNAIITGLSVTGIAIGAILTVSNSKTLSGFFFPQNDAGENSHER